MGAPIYLDVDDEITSAVNRIRSAGPGTVVLVVPYGSRLASSRINFRLLAREASALGRQLVVVAPEPAVRALAASADLATYATVSELEATDGTAPRDRREGSSVREGGSLRGTGASARVATDAGARAGSATGTTGHETGARPARESAFPDRERAAGQSAGTAMVGDTGPQPPSGEAGGSGPGRRQTAAVVIGGIALISLIVAAVAVFAAINLLPTARIAITPATQSLGPLSLSVTADPAVPDVDPDRMVIPATSVEVPVSVSGQFEATGKELIEEKAKGSVTFQNCDTGAAHTFPSGTVVATKDGVTFVTASTVRLERAKINPAFACTAGSTAVTASKAGPEGNVVAGAIEKLPSGYDPVVLTVVNRSATSGGSRTELTRVTRGDVDAALAVLRSQLAEAFTMKAADPDGTPAGSEIIPGTATLGDPAPTSDPAELVGRELASFELGLTATGTVLAVDASPVASVALARLVDAVPNGFQLLDGSVRTVVDQPVISDGAVVYAVTIRAEVTRIVDLATLREQVLGLSIAAARKIVEPFGAVEVTVWPDWVTAIPSDPARVEVLLAETPTPSAPASPPASSPSGQAP